jgi:hypothetical protein
MLSILTISRVCVPVIEMEALDLYIYLYICIYKDSVMTLVVSVPRARKRCLLNVRRRNEQERKMAVLDFLHAPGASAWLVLSRKEMERS